MKLTPLITLAFSLLSTASALDSGTTDNNDEKLQIGVRTAIPESQCPRKTSKGDKLKMHYAGKLKSTGEEFDSSYSRNSPFEFTLGAGQVIKGWDQGLLDMCIGEARRLTIPSSLGYGDRGAGGKIPGGATLIFDVELLEIVGYTPPEMPDLAGKVEL